MPEASKNILQQKLDLFIRKYYLNQLYKGAILFASALLGLWFFVSFLEFIGRFNSAVRFGLLLLYAATNIFLLFRFLVRPLMGLFNLGRNLNHIAAAKLIGQFFPDVKDKLVNALQLQDLTSESALLAASIEQRTLELSPIQFTLAIDFRANLKYVKFALAPALLLLIVLAFSPGFKESSSRVVKYQQTFVPPAPFEFVINEERLRARQGETVVIELELKGDEIPRESYILLGNNRYKMKRTDAGRFEYSIPNVQKTQELQFEAAGYFSKNFLFDVEIFASIRSTDLLLTFPAYLGRKHERLQSIGDLSIPEGTKIQWDIGSKNANALTVKPLDSILTVKDDRVRFDRKFSDSEIIKFISNNDLFGIGDSLEFNVQVIKDERPKISAQRVLDSTIFTQIYFTGMISDDHGFSKLKFSYSVKRGDETTEVMDIPLEFQPDLSKQTFYNMLDLKELGMVAGDVLIYSFSVWDNDGVNGPKGSTTMEQSYAIPSPDQLNELHSKNSEQIKNSLGASQSIGENIEEKTGDIERMLTEKRQLEWSDKQKIEDLLRKQEELQKNLERSIDEIKKNNDLEEEYNDLSEELKQKQERLEKLFEEVMDEEMKALMEKIRDLMNQNDLDNLQQEMQNFKMSQQELNKELDRMLELYKELELEKELEKTVQDLHDLAKEQKELAEQSKEGNKSAEELQDKQEELNEKMKELQEQIKGLQEKNEALESPKDLKLPEEGMNEAKEAMDKASESLSEGKKRNASEQQQKAGEKLEEMANDLKQQKDELYEEQQMEDYQALRQLLENLVQLSFDQEDLQAEFKDNLNYSPKYVELRQEQRRILDESKMVEDSLLALSKRVIILEHFISEEMTRVNDGLGRSLEALGERETSVALVHQQHVMTGYNNLALMLSESLKAMQQQMSSDNESKGKPKANCQKPGSGQKGKNQKPNMESIKKMQQDLAKQLEQMHEGMKKGNQPSSKEFAEMAARQAEIRRQLKELQQRLDKEGKGGSLGNLRETQDLMDEVENDLYNKRLSPASMHRLKELEIKLSEHERAEREQDQDEERSSEEGQDLQNNIPPDIQKYLDEKAKELEQLQRISPQLNPYYQKKVHDYFQN